MKIKDIITESVSSVLYHATTFPSAEKMLTSQTLKGPEISFTRSLQGAYHKDNAIIGVIFQFDGNKLNHNYKGNPVGTENFSYDDPDDYDPDDKDTWEFTGRDNGQLEDRIYAKNGITDLTKYIVNAIIYAPIEYIEDSSYDKFESTTYTEQMQSVVKVLRLLEANNIPYRFVASEKGLVGKTDDKKGFVNVVKQLYRDDYSGNNVKQDTKDEFDVGKTWKLHFSDYTNYDEGDFDSIEQIELPFKGTRDEAVEYGRKQETGDKPLTGITDVDDDNEFTDL